MWVWLTSHYLVDVWSLVHFSVFCAAFSWRKPSSLARCVGYALLITVAWELFEWGSGFLQGSFGGEPWQNRWVSDPVFNLCGALTAYWRGRGKR